MTAMVNMLDYHKREKERKGKELTKDSAESMKNAASVLVNIRPPPGASIEDVVARAGGGGVATTTTRRGDDARMATATATATATEGGGRRGRSDDDGRHPLGGPRSFESRVPHTSERRCGYIPPALQDFVSGYYAAGEWGDGGTVISGGGRGGVGVGWGESGDDGGWQGGGRGGGGGGGDRAR